MNVFVKPSVLTLPEHVAREQKCERRSARCYPWVGYHMSFSFFQNLVQTDYANSLLNLRLLPGLVLRRELVKRLP